MVEKCVALYLRISDEDKAKNNRLDESVSILGQRLILKNFIQGHKELLDYRIMEFIDDGYSGTNFERPAFEELLKSVKNGIIQCIIVKDFSRLGRNYLEVGNYLEQVFPFFGIRFISVNDNFDSLYDLGAAGSIDVGFKNIMNDAYSKDLSEKIKSSRRTRAKQGKFLSSYAPYGYLKDEKDKNRLIIDPECAPIVQLIYDLYLKEESCNDIVKKLNQKQILCPLAIRKKRKENMWQCNRYENTIWVSSTVYKILCDQRYTGDMVYGKLKPAAIGSSRCIKTPEEDWIIIPNVHEGIISHEVFNLAAKRRTKKKSYIKKDVKEHPLAKKLICRSCNQRFTRCMNHGKVIYFCQKSKFLESSTCYTGRISEKEVENSILYTLLILMDFFGKKSPKEKAIQEKKKYPFDLLKLEKDIDKLENNRFKIYEDFKRNKLNEKKFKHKMKEQEDLIKNLQEEYITLEKEYKSSQNEKIIENDMERLQKYSPFKMLTKELLDKFIETIYVESDGTISIKWNFSNPFI